MSRVQCLECGIAVVVDPTGTCPEGHAVGGSGVRVANAMGSAEPHPDEPEPWVATVVLDEADVRPAPRQRAIRPVSVAGADTATEQEGAEAADHESMMRELHALSDMQAGPSAPVIPQIARDTPPARPTATEPATAVFGVPVPPAEATADPRPLPPREQVAEGFAELSALEAAFHALGYDEDTTLRGEPPAPPAAMAEEPAATSPTASTTPTPTTPPDSIPALAPSPRTAVIPSPEPTFPAVAAPTELRDELADFEDLFDSAASAATAPSAPLHHQPAPQPAPAPAAGLAPAPVPPATAAPEPESEPAAAADHPRPGGSSLDITNFTAHGGKVGRARRKRFGR